MKKLVSLLFGCCCAAAALADVIYVKPEACGTGDGSSWANARTDIQDCIENAKNGDEFHLAKGVYYWKWAIDTPGASYSVIGGYAGVSEDETPDDLVNKTVISGDINQDDKWVVYNLRTRATSAAADNVRRAYDRELGPVIVNGELVLPDSSLVGDDEIAVIDETRSGDNTRMMNIYRHKTIRPIFRGLWFVGAGSVKKTAKDGRGSVFYGTTNKLQVENCHFIGNSCVQGVVYLNGDGSCGDQVFLRNCEFKWNLVSQYGIIFMSATDFVLEDIKIVGALHTGTQGSCAYYLSAGSGQRVHNFLIEKCYTESGSYNPSAGIGAAGSSRVTFENGVIRKCWSRGATTATAINTRRSNASDSVGFRFRNILIESNHGVQLQTSNPIENFGIVALAHDGNSLESCTFLDNEVVCVPTKTCKTVTAGTVMLTVREDKIANPPQPYRTIVNCTFKGNEIVFPDGDNGADVTAANSIFVYGPAANNPLECIIANCTFVGGTDYPDLVWFGQDASAPTKVLNSIFWKSGDATDYRPFACGTPNVLEVRDCIFNGYTDLPAGVAGSGNHNLSPLLAEAPEYVSGCSNPVIRASARVPGLRDGPDFRYCVSGNQFYLLNADGSHVSSATVEVADDAPLSDAVGVARPEGSATLGAAQELTAAGEAGWTFSVEAYPASAGTLSGGAPVQVVAKGDSTVEVSVTATDPLKYPFVGWMDDADNLLSTETTLTLKPTDDVHVRAVFEVPKVKYTFVLGNAGTFNATGASTAVCEFDSGADVTVPDFTIDTEHAIPRGWSPAVPAKAGMEDATFTYAYDEKIHRIVRVDTNLAEGGDGSSWASAMTNIQEAIERAGIWTGEVWIKAGVHRVGTTSSAHLTMMNNVRIMGGFEGVDGKYATLEEERAARDFELHRTVLTGDIKFADTWKAVAPDGTVSDLKVKVVQDGAFVLPEIPDGFVGLTDASPDDGTYASSTHCSPMFDHANAALDYTAVLDGLTFVGAAVMDNPSSARPKIVSCTFFGGSYVRTDDAMRFENCIFRNGHSPFPPVYVENVGYRAGSLASTELIDCVFTNAHVRQMGLVTVSGRLVMKGCVFRRCSANSRYDGHALALRVGEGQARILNCSFEENFATRPFSLANLAVDSIVSNCVFRANRMEAVWASSKESSLYYSNPLTILNATFGVRVVDCSFVSNVVAKTVTDAAHVNSTSNGQASVAHLHNSSLVNCSFIDNTVTASTVNPNAPAETSVVGVYQWGISGQPVKSYGGNADLANCTFSGNTTTHGDILQYMVSDSSVVAFNSIFWDDHTDLDPFDVSYSLVKGVSADPQFRTRLVANDYGQVSRMVSGSSPARKAGVNVYSDGTAYYVAIDKEESSFRNLSTRKTVNTKPAGAVLVGDLFGEPRVAGKFTLGALQQTGSKGLVIVIE